MYFFLKDFLIIFSIICLIPHVEIVYIGMRTGMEQMTKCSWISTGKCCYSGEYRFSMIAPTQLLCTSSCAWKHYSFIILGFLCFSLRSIFNFFKLLLNLSFEWLFEKFPFSSRVVSNKSAWWSSRVSSVFRGILKTNVQGSRNSRRNIIQEVEVRVLIYIFIFLCKCQTVANV